MKERRGEERELEGKAEGEGREEEKRRGRGGGEEEEDEGNFFLPLDCSNRYNTSLRCLTDVKKREDYLISNRHIILLTQSHISSSSIPRFFFLFFFLSIFFLSTFIPHFIILFLFPTLLPSQIFTFYS